MTRAIVIFGAAVRPDGQASPSLARRVRYAVAAARAAPASPIFCSGGVGRFGPSEASLMGELLARADIPADRVVLDEDSRDTLENVIAASRFIRAQGLAGAVACTDSYHVPRVRMLFRALGVDALAGPVVAGRAGTRLSHWLGMQAREAAAYPYDLAVVLWRRRELLTLTGAARPD
ncbi:YdcF family protein [Phenylobacterium aquaticum]|uniref:YdcF family protein n=1 Tax=Phenylobacterium aquaticum TaxID=1763816 RepID=UPI0026EC57DE|nr:YdcF family protein [Phenylobacterium aquaticum]